MSERWVFLDVDTQIDFMLPSGALYVPGAEEIIPNLRRLIAFAETRGVPVLSSADAHPPNDPSFAEWPPHCVIGTPGQRRIPETTLASPMIIPNRRVVLPSPFPVRGQIILEKVDYDISSNPNFEDALRELEPARVAAFGVATEYCVRASALALRRQGVPVDLVKDAIRGITEEGSRKALGEMMAAGIRFVTVEQISGATGASV